MLAYSLTQVQQQKKNSSEKKLLLLNKYAKHLHLQYNLFWLLEFSNSWFCYWERFAWTIVASYTSLQNSHLLSSSKAATEGFGGSNPPLLLGPLTGFVLQIKDSPEVCSEELKTSSKYVENTKRQGCAPDPTDEPTTLPSTLSSKTAWALPQTTLGD